MFQAHQPTQGDRRLLTFEHASGWDDGNLVRCQEICPVGLVACSDYRKSLRERFKPRVFDKEVSEDPTALLQNVHVRNAVLLQLSEDRR